MHSDRIEGFHCGWEVLAIANVHDECALLLIRTSTRLYRLVLTFYQPYVSVIASPLTTISHYSGAKLPREKENSIRLQTQLR